MTASPVEDFLADDIDLQCKYTFTRARVKGVGLRCKERFLGGRQNAEEKGRLRHTEAAEQGSGPPCRDRDRRRGRARVADHAQARTGAWGRGYVAIQPCG